MKNEMPPRTMMAPSAIAIALEPLSPVSLEPPDVLSTGGEVVVV
jgi:hypothetical protein